MFNTLLLLSSSHVLSQNSILSAFLLPPLCVIDQTQKQVMTMSVWSFSAWRRWQTCNPYRTSTAPPWRGARRLWRKQTSTSEWKCLLQGLFVNFSTAGAFVLYAFALRLQGFSSYSVPSSDIFTADCIEQILFFLGVIGMRPLYQPESWWVKPRKNPHIPSSI